ncbi:MAG: hypothetical protein V1936_02250 [Patescibacteria group bacterium]
MEISTSTTGIFPKIGGAAPSLRTNLHKFDRAEISEKELEDVIQKNIERAVVEQIQSGIDLPTDGLIRWTDLFSPFVKAWGGMTRRGIHRFYDTNTLYGEPVVESELQFVPSYAAADFVIGQKFGAKKATLPGVFTFAAAIVDNFYRDEKKLRAKLTELLLAEAQELVKSGAQLIEIHEPEIAWNMEHGTWNNEISEIYSKFAVLDAKIIVTSYFRNFTQSTAEGLVQANVGVGLDFSKPLEIKNLSAKLVQIGAVDSRETKLESPAILAERKKSALAKFPDSAIIFSTSSNVEYLPHEIALQKISLLKNLK